MPNTDDNSTLASQIGGAMRRDQFPLRRRLRNIKDHSIPPQLRDAIEKSCQLRRLRAEKMPTPRLDESLPIFARAEEIKAIIAENQVVVLSGETGSGKSTQLPLLALQMGLGTGGLIGHTQPRRIAARSVAARLAENLNSPLGQDVGFKIRFSDQTNERTYIKLMTDGILLAETQGDPFFDQYEMLIVDEAHERSLNIDFVLGFLKNLLPKRPDLKLVITSATIDTDRFAEHFATSTGPAPVIHVEGRTYPVTIEYTPLHESRDEDSEIANAVVEHCRELLQRRDGDVLVFLPTEMDIRNVSKKLKGAIGNSGVDILPLYARLSPAQQSEVFHSHSRCRVVLATNVAESSITVPGIRYVVDTGTARISRYAPRSKVQRLPIEAISQASANQRAGRCGRVAPGICVRLYSEDDYKTRSAFTTPEIRRTNLAGTILQLLTLGFGDVERFPFLDPPSSEHVRDGYKTLFEIGAVDEHRRLTEVGRKLSRLPVDPRIGRMLLEADTNGCLAEMLVIASALELQDPRVRPAEKKAAADTAHAAWNDAQSDFIASLNLWDFIHRLKVDLSRSKFRLALEQNFLSYSLVLQWQDIHRQLLALATDNGLRTRARNNDYSAIHRSLLSGLLSSVAMLEDRHEYTGAGGVKFHLWPGSGVFKTKPKWLMAAEILETTRRYGRTVAQISPDWIMPLAEHLLKHQYVDPFWSDKNESVMALRNTTLYGLPIQSRQRVTYATVDPDLSRKIFIDQGLIEGRIRTDFDFLTHNQLLMEDVANLANKTRQRQFVVDTYVLSRFYSARLPPEATDCRALKSLLKKSPELNTQLQLTHTDLGLDHSADEQLTLLPDKVQVGAIQIPVEYRFEPGEKKDGANISIPIDALGHVDDIQLGWLIPGLSLDRIVGMIRSLPKSIRRNLVPAPDVAKEVAKRLKFGQGSFVESVAFELSKFAGESIAPADFDFTKVDRHLLVNVEVVDTNGEIAAQGRSLQEIREQLAPEIVNRPIQIEDTNWQQSGLTSWSCGDLPESVVVRRGTTELVAYPALVDEGTTVAVHLLDSLAKAETQSIHGAVRLFYLTNKRLLRSQIQWLPKLDAAKVALARWIAPAELVDWLGLLLVRVGMVENQPMLRSESAFAERQAKAVEGISVATQEIATWLPKLSETGHAVALAMESLPQKYAESLAAVKRQLQFLFASKTLKEVPWRWLQHYPRYLRAIESRLQKLPSLPTGQDLGFEKSVHQFQSQAEQLAERHSQQGWFDKELVQFRWMVEEYRVSLFAQQLGTSLTVSPQRLEKQFAKIRKA